MLCLSTCGNELRRFLDEDSAAIATATNLTATLTSTASGSTSTAPIPLTVTFNRAVTGLTLMGFTTTNATVSTLATLSASSYTLNLHPIAAGAVSVSLNSGVARDSSGATHAQSNTLSFTFVAGAAGIRVTAGSGLQTTEAGGTAQFTIRLNSPPTSNVTIALSSADTTEGTVAPASMVFNSTNWSIDQTATITGVNDSILDPFQAYTITTGAATSLDAAYNGINADDVSVTNLDNEKRIYVTQANYSPAFGNFTVIDNLCNTDVNKPATGTYKAIIVTDNGTGRRASVTSNAGDGQIDWVLAANTAYFRPSGTALMTTNANNIFVFGALTNSFGTAAINYWTGLETDWTSHVQDCGNWTSTTGSGNYGLASDTGGNAIKSGGPNCTENHHLLCAEQ